MIKYFKITCDYKNTCYQCPAGNLSVGDAIFRPDAMCKRFAKLHVEIRDLLLQNTFKLKLNSIISSTREEGEVVHARAAVHLILRLFNGIYSDGEEVLEKVKDIDKLILGPNQVLVEIIEFKSSLVLSAGSGPVPNVIEREEVVRSTVEGINVGDIILDARYGLGDKGVLKLGERRLLMANGHDIKMWTRRDNFVINTGMGDLIPIVGQTSKN